MHPQTVANMANWLNYLSIGVSQDAGLRYVNQLEMDLMALKQRVQSARSGEVNR